MSLYIPNVSLPKDGDFELWIAVRKDGSYSYNISGGWHNGRETAVHVPPHGRLGDLDRLALEMMDAKNADQALAIVDDAPTIIPAEEVKES